MNKILLPFNRTPGHVAAALEECKNAGPGLHTVTVDHKTSLDVAVPHVQIPPHVQDAYNAGVFGQDQATLAETDAAVVWLGDNGREEMARRLAVATDPEPDERSEAARIVTTRVSGWPVDTTATKLR